MGDKSSCPISSGTFTWKSHLPQEFAKADQFSEIQENAFKSEQVVHTLPVTAVFTSIKNVMSVKAPLTGQ